jgi:hypothetical protein
MLSGAAPDKVTDSVDCRVAPDDKPQADKDETEASTEPKPTEQTKPKLSTHWWLIVMFLAVACQVWSEIKWNMEYREGDTPRMVVLPAVWLVFTNAIMATMWAIAMRLATLRQCWSDFNALCGPKLLHMRRRAPAEPPDPFKRPTGTMKQGQRMLATIIERERELRHPPTVFD